MSQGDSKVVVVSGLPRSGTSLLMQMLSRGGFPILADGQRPADEDNPRGYFEYQPVKDLDKAGDKSWLSQAAGRALKVVSPLLEHLPDTLNYRVLFMQRNLHEILASQKKMLARRGVSDDTDDRQMFTSYLKHLDNIDHLLKNSPRFETCFLRYRKVLAQPLEQADRICRFLQAPLDRQAMAAAVDPALYRNRDAR